MNLFPFFEYNIAYLRFFHQFFPKLCHIVLQKYVPHLFEAQLHMYFFTNDVSTFYFEVSTFCFIAKLAQTNGK